MAVRPILTLPHPILRTVCAAARPPAEAWAGVIRDLWDTLDSHVGVGIAAPQIGEHGDLVGEVRVLGPAVRDHPSDIPHVFVVQPGDNSLEPPPKLCPQVRIDAGRRVPGPRQHARAAQRLLLFIAPVERARGAAQISLFISNSAFGSTPKLIMDWNIHSMGHKFETSKKGKLLSQKSPKSREIVVCFGTRISDRHIKDFLCYDVPKISNK